MLFFSFEKWQFDYHIWILHLCSEHDGRRFDSPIFTAEQPKGFPFSAVWSKADNVKNIHVLAFEQKKWKEKKHFCKQGMDFTSGKTERAAFENLQRRRIHKMITNGSRKFNQMMKN